MTPPSGRATTCPSSGRHRRLRTSARASPCACPTSPAAHPLCCCPGCPSSPRRSAPAWSAPARRRPSARAPSPPFSSCDPSWSCSARRSPRRRCSPRATATWRATAWGSHPPAPWRPPSGSSGRTPRPRTCPWPSASLPRLPRRRSPAPRVRAPRGPPCPRTCDGPWPLLSSSLWPRCCSACRCPTRRRWRGLPRSRPASRPRRWGPSR
mmetsp:Transcript_55969/g.162241  ORF Transcript_55969/g.162241 Transcript_55969/m.162241 type:complete len:209 (-) Transcript_55969:373-999(-)